MTPGGITQGVAPDWLVPSFGTLVGLAVVSLLLGLYQFVRGFGRWTNLVLGVVVGCFVFGFLTWAVGG